MGAPDAVPVPEAIACTPAAVEAVVLGLPAAVSVAGHGQGTRSGAALAAVSATIDTVADGRDTRRPARRWQIATEGAEPPDGRAGALGPGWQEGPATLVGSLPALVGVPRAVPGPPSNGLTIRLRTAVTSG